MADANGRLEMADCGNGAGLRQHQSSRNIRCAIEYVGPGLGYGLIALTDLPQGTVVLRERALAVLRASELGLMIAEDPHLQTELQDAEEAALFSDERYWPAAVQASDVMLELFASRVFAKLPAAQQYKWLSLADSFSMPPGKSPGNIVRSNAFTDVSVGDTYLYEVLSRANHSCRPNISRAFEGPSVVVTTTRAVVMGEPLVISYLSDAVLARPTDERRAALRHKFRFLCECERCGKAASPAKQPVAPATEPAAAVPPQPPLIGSTSMMVPQPPFSGSTPMMMVLHAAGAALQRHMDAYACGAPARRAQPNLDGVATASAAACADALRAVEGAQHILGDVAAELAPRSWPRLPPSELDMSACGDCPGGGGSVGAATILARMTTSTTDSAAAASLASTTPSAAAAASLASRLGLATQPVAALLDLRSADAFASEHLRGAASFPLSTLPHRTAELPPASASGGLRLLGESVAVLAEARRFLHEQGTSRWAIIDELVASPELWQAARHLRLVSLDPSRRLWAPSPHLPQLAPRLEAALPCHSARWRALDLGCGRGRDCLWLALRGWQVVGVDNQQAFLDHTAAFAAREGLPPSAVETTLLDLRRCERATLEALLAPPLALVVVARFMSRRLLSTVLEVMPTGCTLAVHHFRAGATSLKSCRAIKEADADACALAPGECLRRFGSPSLELLMHEEGHSADGRPTVDWAVRKVGPWVKGHGATQGALAEVSMAAQVEGSVPVPMSTPMSAPAPPDGAAQYPTAAARSPASAPCAQDVLASSGVLALCEGRLLLSGKSVVQDEATLRLANVAHIVGLTPQPMPPPPAASGASYSHVAVGGGASHADTVRRIRRAIEAIASALDAHTPRAVLVHCSRGPHQGGASGAVGAAYLLHTGAVPSLAAALTACGAKPRGLTLAALYALELRWRGQASDLGSWLGQAACAAVWEADAAEDLAAATRVGPPPAPLPTRAAAMEAAATAPESVVVHRGHVMRVQVVSRDPQVASIAHFVSAAEAAHLAALARPHLSPSRVARTETAASGQVVGDRTAEAEDEQGTGGSSVGRTADECASSHRDADGWRTSTSTSIGGGALAEGIDAADPIVAAVIERAAYLSGLSSHHAEDLQVVRYEPGQQYREHCDWFSPTQDASCVARTRERGNRLVSIFTCLQACERGGETEFTRLGLSFGLGRGEALLWMNVDRHGLLDGRTLHAGRPIDAGEKLGLNVWLRQRPCPVAATGSSQQPDKAGRKRGEAQRADDGRSPPPLSSKSAWRPLEPPPRPTLAPPGAQLSDGLRERPW